MAVGDVINGISGDNALLTFQPAAGVECVITIVFYGDSGGTFNPALYNGTNIAYRRLAANEFSGGVVKFPINNTRYLYISARGAGYYGGYAGIQTK